jgi:endonuclease YncB( thermonuclease family)
LIGHAMARAPLLWLCVLALLPGPPLRAATPASPVLAGHVLRIVDGDTLDVLLASGRIRVRLYGVDAPEGRQAGGRAAALWLRQQLQDADVELQPRQQDRYERLVAVVFHRDRNVNLALLQAGQGWAYRHYLRRSEREYCAAEAAARLAGRGLWALPAAQQLPPWEFRRPRQPAPTQGVGAAALPACVAALGR